MVVVFEADLAGVEPFDSPPGFAAFGGVFELEAALAGAAGAFDVTALLVDDADLLAAVVDFAGTAALAVTAALAATSVLTGLGTSFGAGGFAGFFFGGNCNSANRSITSPMDCSESA